MDSDAAQEILERIALLGTDLFEGADVPDNPDGEPQLLGVLGLHDEDQDPARRIADGLVDRVNRDHELGRIDVHAPLGAVRVNGQVAEREHVRVGDEHLGERDDRRVFVNLSPRLRGMAERMDGAVQAGFERKGRDRNRGIRQGTKTTLHERKLVLFDRGLGRNAKEFELVVAVRRKDHDAIPNGIALGLGGGLVGFDAPSQAQSSCENAEVQGGVPPKNLSQTLPLSATLQGQNLYPKVTQINYKLVNVQYRKNKNANFYSRQNLRIILNLILKCKL